MTFAPPPVQFSNPENTDPTYSKFKSSHQQDSPFPLSTHAERDVLANGRFAPEAVDPGLCLGGPDGSFDYRLVSVFPGKVIQKSVQRFFAGIVRRPMGAIARAGNLDAHGMASASNLPAEGISTIPATAHHDIIGSVPIVGMHAQTNRRGGPLPIGDLYLVQATVDSDSSWPRGRPNCDGRPLVGRCWTPVTSSRRRRRRCRRLPASW